MIRFTGIPSTCEWRTSSAFFYKKFVESLVFQLRSLQKLLLCAFPALAVPCEGSSSAAPPSLGHRVFIFTGRHPSLGVLFFFVAAMGNMLACVGNPDSSGEIGSRSEWRSKLRSSRKTMPASEEEEPHQWALAIAIQQHQSSQRFGGSMSRRTGGSTVSRRRDLSDSIPNGKQHQVILEEVETKKIILVHGEGFGAWCWYKTLSLLEEVGLHPVALDLRGSGIDRTEPSRITTLADYSKPLTDYLHSLHDEEKLRRC